MKVAFLGAKKQHNLGAGEPAEPSSSNKEFESHITNFPSKAEAELRWLQVMAQGVHGAARTPHGQHRLCFSRADTHG